MKLQLLSIFELLLEILPLKMPKNDVVVIALHSHSPRATSVTCISKTRDSTMAQ